MLELLLASCFILTVGIIGSTSSGSLFNKLISIKLMSSGAVALGMVLTRSVAPELTTFVIHALTIVTTVLIGFAALLLLRHYQAKKTVETDKMIF